MGTGASTKESDDSNVDSILIKENNSFFSVFNRHVTVISSMTLLMVLILIACLICLVINLRLCSRSGKATKLADFVASAWKVLRPYQLT